MKVETKRVHGEAKALKIRAFGEGKETFHPYDTEIPEKAAHLEAAVAHIRRGSNKSLESVEPIIEHGPGHYEFEFREVEP